MKKIFVFLFIIKTFFCFGQEIKVLDNLLKTPIENVNLICKEVGVSTNEKGLVNISVFKENDSIRFTHLSYYTKSIIFSDVPQIIYLSAKIKILPTIIFKEDKTPLLGWDIVYETKTVNKKIVS